MGEPRGDAGFDALPLWDHFPAGILEQPKFSIGKAKRPALGAKQPGLDGDGLEMVELRGQVRAIGQKQVNAGGITALLVSGINLSQLRPLPLQSHIVSSPGPGVDPEHGGFGSSPLKAPAPALH